MLLTNGCTANERMHKNLTAIAKSAPKGGRWIQDKMPLLYSCFANKNVRQKVCMRGSTLGTAATPFPKRYFQHP